MSFFSCESDVVDFNSSIFNDVCASISIVVVCSVSAVTVATENEETEGVYFSLAHPVPVVGTCGTAVAQVVNVVSVGVVGSTCSGKCHYEVDVVDVGLEFSGGFCSKSVVAFFVVFNVRNTALEVHAGSVHGGGVTSVNVVERETDNVVNSVVEDSDLHELFVLGKVVIEGVEVEVFEAKSVRNAGVKSVACFIFRNVFNSVAVFINGVLDFRVILNCFNYDGVSSVINGDEFFIVSKVVNEVLVGSQTELFSFGISTEVETSEYGGNSGGGFSGSTGAGAGAGAAGRRAGAGAAGRRAGAAGAAGRRAGAAGAGRGVAGTCGVIGIVVIVVITTNESENSEDHCNYHHESQEFLHDKSSPFEKNFFDFCYRIVSVTIYLDYTISFSFCQ